MPELAASSIEAASPHVRGTGSFSHILTIMAAKKKAKRKPNPALMKPVQPDDVLATITGNKPLPRGQITKKIWDYIKKNGLQDKAKKTMINADAKLKDIFKKAQVSMFEMTKLINSHLK